MLTSLAVELEFVLLYRGGHETEEIVYGFKARGIYCKGRQYQMIQSTIDGIISVEFVTSSYDFVP
jgi:hypothetical protein